MKKLAAVVAIFIASVSYSFSVECFYSFIQEIDCGDHLFVSVYEYYGSGAGCDPAVTRAVFLDALNTFEQNESIDPC